METIGSRLRAFIEAEYGKRKLGVFAEDAGITPSQLSEYLKDKYVPRDETLKRFADLGLNLHWLITGEGEMVVQREGDEPDNAVYLDDDGKPLPWYNQPLFQQRFLVLDLETGKVISQEEARDLMEEKEQTKRKKKGE